MFCRVDLSQSNIRAAKKNLNKNLLITRAVCLERMEIYVKTGVGVSSQYIRMKRVSHNWGEKYRGSQMCQLALFNRAWSYCKPTEKFPRVWTGIATPGNKAYNTPIFPTRMIMTVTRWPYMTVRTLWDGWLQASGRAGQNGTTWYKSQGVLRPYIHHAAEFWHVDLNGVS